MKSKLNRRMILRGMGACVALPLLESVSGIAQGTVAHGGLVQESKFEAWEKSSSAKPRIIFCYVPNGMNILEWLPKEAGKKYELSKTLEILTPHRDDFSVISGLGHPNAKGGHSGADTWLTGADLTSIPGSDYSNSVSIDQVIAEFHGKQTRFSSLQFADDSGTGTAGHSYTLSFDRSGTPLPAENNPRRIFDRLFVPDLAADRAATLRRYAQKKSILDSVLNDAKRLNRDLGKQDQRKLDQYLSSVRETEQRVERLESWIDVEKPKVDASNLALDREAGDQQHRPMWIDVMLELSYLSFATDTTRVISFEWSREAGGFGGRGENHHELSHHGGDEGMLARLGEIDRFHVGRLNRFLDLLKVTKDGDANMLDNTIVVFGCGMNSGVGGEHSPKNLPLLVAGGSKLGLKHGQHLAFDDDNHPPMSNLLLSLAQAMGLESDQFSDASGTLTGI